MHTYQDNELYLLSLGRRGRCKEGRVKGRFRLSRVKGVKSLKVVLAAVKAGGVLLRKGAITLLNAILNLPGGVLALREDRRKLLLKVRVIAVVVAKGKENAVIGGPDVKLRLAGQKGLLGLSKEGVKKNGVKAAALREAKKARYLIYLKDLI